MKLAIIIILSVLLGISILVNIVLLDTINMLEGELQGFCELTNKATSFVNELIGDNYPDLGIEKIEMVNCDYGERRLN